MPSVEDRTDLLAVALAVCLAAVGICLLFTRRTWPGQHLPLPLHPSRPGPGAVPRMVRGMRTRPYRGVHNAFIIGRTLGTRMGMMYHHHRSSSMGMVGLVVAMIGLSSGERDMPLWVVPLLP